MREAYMGTSAAQSADFEEAQTFHLDVADWISDELYDETLSLHGATIYHTRAWHSLLTRTLGWQVKAIAVRDQAGELVWALPFVRKRRVRFQQVNVCLPLSDRIGPVRKEDLCADQLPSLREQVWPIEIHERASIPGLHHMVQHYITELDLTRYGSLENLKRSFHKSNVQRKLKRAEKSGMRIVKGTVGDHFDVFHKLQIETRHRQGSPMYPRRFFETMWEELKQDDLIHLYLAYLDDRAVSGIIFLHFRDTAVYGYGASVNDRDVWRLGANQLTMWSAIKDAYEMKISRIDFGTSPAWQPDLRRYKERWGAESRELAYTFGNEKETQVNINPSGMAVKVASWTLRHLPEPLFVGVSRYLLRIVV